MLEPDKDDDFCLKWNNHHRTFMNVLHGLMKKEILVDVTLAAEGKFIEAHKLVLCTCSEYFQDVLSTHDNKQAYIFLNNIAFDDLYALVEYMYKGEVNVSQEQLPRFIAAAEALKIKGLSDKTSAPALSDNQDEETAPQPRSKKSKNAASRRLNSPRIPNLSYPDMQLQNQQSHPAHHSFHEASIGNIEDDQKLVSSLQLFSPSLHHRQQQDDNFISVNASEEIDHQEDDGLGTLDKVWSMDQENGHDWTEDRHHSKNNPQGDSFHPNLPETDITDSSIDYQHFATSSSSTNVDPSMGVPGIEEVLPGPSSTATLRTVKSLNSRHSSTVSSGIATAVPALASNDSVNRGKMVCPTCGRVYTQKGSLNRHLKFECGIIPKFACEICPMRFRRAYKLTEHYKRVHGGPS